MARRVYADFDGYLDQRLGNRSDITSQMRGHWLNDALQLCANEFDHKELQGRASEVLPSTADSLTPSIATDLWWPRMLKNGVTGQPIIQRDLEEIEGIAVKPTMNPTRFYWWNGVFYFDGKPAANLAIELWYWKQPPEWTANALVLDKVYDPIVELYSAMIAHQFFREFDKAHMIETEANNYAARMNLPLRKAKLNDYLAGIQVRTR